MSSINELCQQLNILPPLSQSTCIGYGQRKPTCGCAVALSSRESADRTLRDISYDILTGENAQESSLKKVAGLLLCCRYHQFQADELTAKWSAALGGWSPQVVQLRDPVDTRIEEPKVSIEQCKKLEAELRALREEKKALETNVNNLIDRMMTHGGLEYIVTGKPRPLVTPPFVTSAEMQRATDDILVEELRRRIRFDPVFRTHTSLHNVTAPLHERPTARSESVETVTSPSVDQVRDTVPQQSSRSTPLNQDDLPTQRSTRITIGSVLENPDLTGVPQPHIRHSHTECAACFEPYNDDERHNHWECCSCRNRMHAECFSIWADAAGGRNVRCIYCRATVSVDD